MPKVHQRNRNRISIDLKNEEIEMLLYTLRIAFPQTKGKLESFILALWDQFRDTHEHAVVVEEVGDL